ncbi:hypothetical protein [uncultured Clostridium sp.]|uniref:hypothetical protein n=1 Tax=uncultured Clostridium sp. TaxID=59620 RepID=UPI00262F9B7E|nr:hypothetical protein [uncultured Clostridium sp.]
MNLYSIAELEETLQVSKQTIYKKIKNEEYKDQVMKIKGVTKVSENVLNKLKIEFGIDKPDIKEDEISITEDDKEDLILREKITSLENESKMLKTRITFLEDENIDLRKLLHKNINMVDQEQQLNLKALTSIEELSKEKKLLVEAHEKEIKNKSFFQKMFSK